MNKILGLIVVPILLFGASFVIINIWLMLHPAALRWCIVNSRTMRPSFYLCPAKVQPMTYDEHTFIVDELGEQLKTNMSVCLT